MTSSRLEKAMCVLFTPKSERTRGVQLKNTHQGSKGKPTPAGEGKTECDNKCRNDQGSTNWGQTRTVTALTQTFPRDEVDNGGHLLARLV